MNIALCQAFGGAFPLPFQLASLSILELQKCGVGYRADRIIRLAKAFLHQQEGGEVDESEEEQKEKTKKDSKGKNKKSSALSSLTTTTTTKSPSSSSSSSSLDALWLESRLRTSEEVFEEVKRWHGFGPYAASNLCQLLGHYDRIPADVRSSLGERRISWLAFVCGCVCMTMWS